MKFARMLFSAFLLLGCASVQYIEQSTTELAPGITYVHYRTADTNQVHVLRVHLNAKGFRLEAARSRGLVRTSAIAESVSTADAPVLAAINADFFSFTSGWPVGIQMHEGEFWTALETARSHLLINGDGEPRIDRVTFAGRLEETNGSRLVIDAINQPLPKRGVALYSPRWYDSTAGFGIKLRSIDLPLHAGLPFRAIADSIGGFTMTVLKQDELLLLVSGIAKDSLAEKIPSCGDTLTFLLDLVPRIPGVKEALGGAGRLLRAGNPVLDQNIQLERLKEDFMSRRHPRTFVGLGKESRMLYLCVVDGRQATSVGMTFMEMIEFLNFLGAEEGFNFDGGGSSTMFVRGRVVNSPSDKTGERPVANALVIRKIP